MPISDESSSNSEGSSIRLGTSSKPSLISSSLGNSISENSGAVSCASVFSFWSKLEVGISLLFDSSTLIFSATKYSMDLRTNTSLSEFDGFSDTNPAEIADLIASDTRVCFPRLK